LFEYTVYLPEIISESKKGPKKIMRRRSENSCADVDQTFESIAIPTYAKKVNLFFHK